MTAIERTVMTEITTMNVTGKDQSVTKSHRNRQVATISETGIGTVASLKV